MSIYALPHKYASPTAQQSESWRCIAPTASGDRCKLPFRVGDPNGNKDAEARSTKRSFESLPRGAARDKLIGEFLILCCCSKHHDFRLRDEPGCLASLVQTYSSVLGAVAAAVPARSYPPQNSAASTVRSYHTSAAPAPAPATPTPTYYQGHAMITRSQVNGAEPLIFHPFRNAVNIDMRRQLLDPPINDSGHDLVRRGRVYCFKIPSQPGYVKIGFTARNVAHRLEEWRSCYPDGELLYETKEIVWPWAVEQLVHLELRERRVQAKCKFCRGVYHNEWFQTTINRACDTIKEWSELAMSHDLFDSSSCRATAAWRARILSLSSEVTAWRLLDVAEKIDSYSYETVSSPKYTQVKTPRVISPPSPKYTQVEPTRIISPPAQASRTYAPPEDYPRSKTPLPRESTPYKSVTPVQPSTPQRDAKAPVVTNIVKPSLLSPPATPITSPRQAETRAARAPTPPAVLHKPIPASSMPLLVTAVPKRSGLRKLISKLSTKTKPEQSQEKSKQASAASVAKDRRTPERYLPTPPASPATAYS
ncbi:hypothetical protein MRB53_040697 [Persea americana]|nr:hypothetical protein MRB53_040697 [Persea americana]